MKQTYYYFLFIIFLLTSCQYKHNEESLRPLTNTSWSLKITSSWAIWDTFSWSIQSGSWEVDIRVGNCLREYNLKTKNGKYRKFEFIFRGKCEQKWARFIEQSDENLFRIASWQKAVIMNFLLSPPVDFKKDAKESFSSLFTTNQYHDNWKINGIDMYISSIKAEGYTDNQNIMIGYNGVFIIWIEWVPWDKVKQEYEDLLWTLKNGFREIPTQNTTLNTAKIDFSKTVFMNGGVMVYDTSGLNQFYKIDILIGDPKPNVGIWICHLPVGEVWNSHLDISCSLESFGKTSFRWKSEVYQWSNSEATEYETNVVTWKTKKYK